jgi:recombination protein RecA
MLSAMIPTLTAPARKSGCIILFISQYREKIGVMFGDPTTTTGGNALKFYASQRLDIAKCGQEKNGDEVVANKIRVKVKKNKVAPPFKQAEFQIVYGEGVDKMQELVTLGVDYSVIKKRGSWYSYGEHKIGQGMDSVKKLMSDNPELCEEIENKIKDAIGL